jgi:hypothetical protein
MVCLNAPTTPALPPPDDIPEEILRTEIVVEARSPLDGQPVTASEYAELKGKLAQSPYPPQLSPQIEQLIFLLKIRKLIKTLTPF